MKTDLGIVILRPGNEDDREAKRGMGKGSRGVRRVKGVVIKTETVVIVRGLLGTEEGVREMKAPKEVVDGMMTVVEETKDRQHVEVVEVVRRRLVVMMAHPHMVEAGVGEDTTTRITQCRDDLKPPLLPGDKTMVRHLVGEAVDVAAIGEMTAIVEVIEGVGEMILDSAGGVKTSAVGKISYIDYFTAPSRSTE